MIRSYVAIVSRHGLELLVPENQHVARFMLRRAERSRARDAVCYWAVMPDSAAAQVLRHVALGDYQSALRALESLAPHLGPILPFDASQGAVSARG